VSKKFTVFSARRLMRDGQSLLRKLDMPHIGAVNENAQSIRARLEKLRDSAINTRNPFSLILSRC